MFQKLRIFLLLFLCCSVITFAQGNKKTALIKGRLINKSTTQPANNVLLTIASIKLEATSDGEGNFTFSSVPYGVYHILVSDTSYKKQTIDAVVNTDVVDLGDVVVTHKDATGITIENIEIPTIALDDNNVVSDDNGGGVPAVSGILTTSRDPFVNAVSFNFLAYRFQSRGYDHNQQQVQVNGITMNDVETGDASWSQWGGLNDVFRGRNNAYGLTLSDYTYGGLNGSVYFDASAANQYKQTRVTYTLADRNFRSRLMFTKSSGLMKNGWAYSISVSKRWAKEGYIPGTFYDGYSYYAAASKVYKKHQFNFIAFGAPTRRGKASVSVDEAYQLAGNNYYNDNWGYQNGEIRNARVNTTFQPVFILNHEYKPSNKTTWSTSLAYQFGKNANSALDWYNAADPRPDYYRYLPSYSSGAVPPDANTAAAVRQQLMSNSSSMQVDWNRLYNVNYSNVVTMNNVDGVAGRSITGKQSVYVIGSDVDAINKATFNTNIHHNVNEHVTLYAGVTGISQRTESYKQLTDLLGGDYYVNYNQFAARQYIGNDNYSQNNLNDPNQIIRVGDKYNYDYISHFNKGWLWGQAAFTYNKFDFFVAANGGINSFSREGLYRNGLFPNNSYGESPTQSFLTYAGKAGVTYKIDGRNYLFVNAGYSVDAPTIENTYISPRTRDFTISDPKTQQSQTIEGGYLLHAPRFNARVVAYATDITDQTIINRYYNDDPTYQTFVNYVMQNVNTRFIGTELAVSAKVIPSLEITAVAALGQAFYTNRPDVSVYKDNDSVPVSTSRQVYIKNYYLSVGPQSAYSLGFNYQFKHDFYGRINFNYFDRNYVEIDPDRRTPEAVDLLTPGSDQWHAVMDQEKLPSVFTVDIYAGKSFRLSQKIKRLPYGTTLNVSVGVYNLLNNTNIINTGFEQLRFDYTGGNIDKFPSKYIYGPGINFIANVGLRF